MSLKISPDFFLNLFEGDVNGEAKHCYQFKAFRLDVEERQLLHNGSPVPLTPKAFDVLALLVKRGGHLVEKDELLKLVWADSFVEEANVARTVHTLRRTLGEDDNGNKFIETVAKKGYRFVAKVKEVRETPAPKPTKGKPDTETQRRRENGDAEIFRQASPRPRFPTTVRPHRRTQIILYGIGFLSAVLLLVVLSFNFQTGSSVNPKGVKSIAVLPVQPLAAENRNAIYELGIADSLILKLGTTKNFITRPLSATRKYTDIRQDPLAAGKEMRVDYVLASGYQLSNGKIRVTSQLFNVASGQIEETYKGEKDAANVFAAQDAIADELGKILLTRFNVASGSPAAKRGTTNEEAYRLYLHGRILTDNRNAKDALKAVEYFKKAIELDPDFARAYSGIAHAFIASGNRGSGLPRDEYEKAKEAVTKALELDNNLSESYAVSGELKFVYEWNFTGAEKDLLRAVELEPASHPAHEQYASLLAVRGRFEEAITEAKIAQEIAPNSPAVQESCGRILYLARRYDEAILQFKRKMEVFNQSSGWLWLAYEMRGDYAGAYESFIKLQEKTDAEHLEIYQTAYQTAGWRGVRQKYFEKQKLEENNPGSNLYALARQSALLGEKEQAFEYLNKAIEKRHAQVVMLGVEPSFDILRDDPRFDELLKRVGLK